MNKLLRTSLLAVLMAGVSAHAMAQTADERIAALEAKINALTGELSDLKAETKKANQDINKKLSATATLNSGRPQINSADGANRFAIRGILQFDAASYDGRNTVPGNTDFNSGTNFRRARIGVEGTVAKDWNYNLTGEFGGGGGTEAAQLIGAYIEYVGFKPLGSDAMVRLRVGGWATPTGLEDATANTEALFLERPAVAEMVRGLAGGDARSGAGVLANGERWTATAVFTGGLVGGTGEFDEQTGFLTRVAFDPIAGKDYAVHVGGSVQGILSPADTAAGSAKITQVRLRERPELRVDGTRLVDTGALNSGGLTAYGAELGAYYKNLQVSAEVFRIDVDRTGGFNPHFGGWYVQGAWTLTGESHAWTSATGGFRGIRPAAAFNPADGTWGAWEIATRYSVLDLNDHAGLAGAATPAGGVRGGEQRIATVGLNWYPNAVYRFQAQFQHVDVDRLSATGVQVGEDVDIVSVRSQVAF
ncbi:MAG: OprO/OprP family phosphate-selective porin [Alphaproteobacteria bacterium]|nr:OprO/OprP family phosphate-selective porin [Alphaproteobacteria bacterium]MBU1513441.1 OprO/OprP family phosphate-selective porin [Alphaproteobacteria bacterium]MBU2096433.1 OprO/OprP family phosphate-selective porin [Alphaproteobacteria bacterium]MBU2149875.1 OprO/OprP family phosphate-selective porin [Alphaproteobacteria bacterium]MBU2308219.1 OprO/OprP family phosphate-selective porin [Alphaproteobacteria bacterium]